MDKKVILGAILFSFSYSFGFQDSDLDGVEDSMDKCPNTPFFVIVDQYGCPVKEIPIKRKKVKFYLRVGFTHSEGKDYESNSISYSLAASFRKFYVSYTIRYYTYIRNVGKGLGNSSLYMSYRKFIKNLGIYTGLRITIPTASEDISSRYVNFTPSLFFNYFKGKSDIFFYIDRAFRSNPSGRDTWLFSFGYGYSFSSVYANFSLDFIESSVRSIYNKYINFFILFDITRDLYTTINLSKGLNEEATDRSLSVKFGIRF